MFKKPLLFGALLLGATSLVGCNKPSSVTTVTGDYYIVVNLGEDIDYSYAHQINEAVNFYLGHKLPITIGTESFHKHEIILDPARKDCYDLQKTLGDYEYAIQEKDGKIIIAATSHMSKMCAVDHLLTAYFNKKIKIPKNTLVKGQCKPDDIVTEIVLPEDQLNGYQRIRDPFIVKNGDDYYMYGTHGGYDGDIWQAYHTTGSFKNNWEILGSAVDETEIGADIRDQRWAPEVHKYKDNYYMFTTYRSNKTGKRGVTIFKSPNLEEKFKIISKNPKNEIQPGHITDDSIECTIDGTLYVDPKGQPWLVYVNEWVDQPDEVGLFSAVKLSDDLSTIDESTNRKLFRADDAPWGIGDGVTDGCFIHTLPSGRLVMTWSKGNGHGYAVGFATSDHGILGPWVQHDQLLFAAGMYKGDSLEGGHSMFFNDNNQMYMCLHGPNGDTEHPIIVPVKETPYNTIAWDIYNYINK